jgi:hypothetical protein
MVELDACGGGGVLTDTGRVSEEPHCIENSGNKGD